MEQIPTMESSSDGPYIVKNLQELKGADGASLPSKAVMALCRCGGSATKPFCDGTHKKNGFSGQRLADDSSDSVDVYHGKMVAIHDNRSICAHAGRCTDGLAAVFKYGSEPWIDPDGAKARAIVETIEACPSGALSYSLESADHWGATHPPSVTVSKDGPYEVRGDVRLLNQPWAKGASTDRYTLCRCGASKNKPFCDGTHWEIEFKDPT
ncbi:MAG: CDGSH iron-sulfur domain-containing protein [Usitatibacter sp.]